MSCQIRAIFQNKNKKYLPKHINKQNLIFLSLTPFFLCSLSYINVIFFSLILAGSRRKEGRTLSLPSSLPPPFSMNIFAFVTFNLEVSLTHFTSHKVLSIISDDLFRPAMKPQGLGFSIGLVSSSSMFAGFSLALVTGF